MYLYLSLNLKKVGGYAPRRLCLQYTVSVAQANPKISARKRATHSFVEGEKAPTTRGRQLLPRVRPSKIPRHHGEGLPGLNEEVPTAWTSMAWGHSRTSYMYLYVLTKTILAGQMCL